MSRASPLTTLIELAERAADEAASKLGSAIRHSEQLELKLNLLRNYREDYALKMQTELKAGLEVQQIRNFQLFLQKIDDAVKGQYQVVTHAKNQVQVEKINWQEHEKKKLSYLTLEERAAKALLKKEAKRDQLQTDEHGTRQLFYKQ